MEKQTRQTQCDFLHLLQQVDDQLMEAFSPPPGLPSTCLDPLCLESPALKELPNSYTVPWIRHEVIGQGMFASFQHTGTGIAQQTKHLQVATTLVILLPFGSRRCCV